MIENSQATQAAALDVVPAASLTSEGPRVSAEKVAKRARLAFILAAGFYLYALVIMAAFIAVGTLAFVAVQAVPNGNTSGGTAMCAVIPVTLFCFASALFIGFNLLPLPRRFVAPGPRLDVTTRPKLLDLIRQVAERTDQPVPSEFYILRDANALVTERGGIFGARRHRVLALGLPLFSILSVSQFRTVLAHEFAHFYWGDTRLGPWLYRAFEAIDNTLKGLVQAKYTAWINLLFFWYADLLHEVVQALMKEQEFLADQLAAEIAGSRPFIEGMQLLHIADGSFAAYLSGTIAPLLDFGVRVPILEGFARYVNTQSIGRLIESKIATYPAEDGPWNYSDHPMLAERVAAVKHLPAWPPGKKIEEDPSAITLLDHVDELDVALLGVMIGKKKVEKLRFVPWEEAITEAYFPMWVQMVRTYQAGLAGVTPEMLPDIAKRFSQFGMEMLNKSKILERFDALSGQTSTALGAALALALHNAGWGLHVVIGEPVYAQREDIRIEPFTVIGKLASQRKSVEEWREQCQLAGITGMDFGKLVTG